MTAIPQQVGVNGLVSTGVCACVDRLHAFNTPRRYHNPDICTELMVCMNCVL